MKTASKKPAKPAAPSVQTASDQDRHIPIKKIFAFIALAAIVTLAGILTYQHEQQRKADERAYQADKARFAAVEADMQTSKDDIVGSIGKPTKVKLKKICSHTSLKYEKGTLYCSVSYGLTYDNQSAQNYKEQARRIPDAINRNHAWLNEASQEKYFEGLEKTLSADVRLSGSDEMVCNLSAEYSEISSDENLSLTNGKAVATLFNVSAMLKKPSIH